MSSGCTCSNVISFEDVSFAYGSNVVLENTSFSVCKKDFAAIIGPNGGGKTTILNLVLGLLKPQQGRINVLGSYVGKANSKIGYVSQSASHDLHFPITVLDVVLMGRLRAGYSHYNQGDCKVALACLDQVKMVNFQSTHFFQLSGGQQQRVLIARALAGQPELLILDEATSNLDVEAEETLYKLLAELNKDITIVMVSHDLGFVSTSVKTVLCVRNGVQIHPTSQLTGDIVSEIYGGNVSLIRHDHRCSDHSHLYGSPHSPASSTTKVAEVTKVAETTNLIESAADGEHSK